MAYIYQIVNDINQKIYVGKTEFSIEKRFIDHCYEALKDRAENRPLYRAMRKYGIAHFHIELIEETDNPEEREIYWIEAKDSYRNGYNATLGGDGRRRYDYSAIAERLTEFPYPTEVAKEFGCSADVTRAIAKQHHIAVKNSSSEKMKEERSKPIMQFDKENNYIAQFNSVADAARWCYDTKKCKTLNSGVRGHIADCANGKRKTAYGYIWKYLNN